MFIWCARETVNFSRCYNVYPSEEVHFDVASGNCQVATVKRDCCLRDLFYCLHLKLCALILERLCNYKPHQSLLPHVRLPITITLVDYLGVQLASSLTTLVPSSAAIKLEGAEKND